jgi:cystathionine gamma-lyase
MSPVPIGNNSYQTNGHVDSPFTNGHAVHKPKKELGFGTRAVHIGSEPDAATGAVIPPISLSTTYKQDAIGVHKVRYL